MSGGKHAPNRLDTFLAVHQANMDQVVRGGFVTSDDLSFDFVDDGSIVVDGSIECVGGIVITVSMRLAVLGGTGRGKRVQISGYSYNVRLAGVGNVFRYDSPDPAGERSPDAPPHHSEHHVHRYDVLNGDRVGKVECLWNAEDAPTLREVIDEAQDWFYAHVDVLRNDGLYEAPE